MYENKYDTQTYEGSALDVAAKSISDGRTRLAFLDYAVRYYGVLPQSTTHEALAALAAFRRREYADYTPPVAPKEFDSEYDEAGYNMRKATYDVKYWRRVAEEGLPTPVNTDPNARLQFAMRDFAFTFVDWFAVCGPTLTALVDKAQDTQDTSIVLGSFKEAIYATDEPIHFTPVMTNLDLVPDPEVVKENMAMEEMAKGVFDLYQKELVNFETADLANLVSADGPLEFCARLDDENFAKFHQQGLITEQQIGTLIERAKTIVRVRAENFGVEVDI